MTSLVNYFFESTRPFKRALPKKKWIRLCVGAEKKEIECINFIFCTDAYLQKINKKYLGQTYLTDVISFDNRTKKTNNIIGDIFISIERVKSNSSAYKTTYKEELARVIIHGTLHLIGYKDKKKVDKEIMTEKENFYLKLK